MHEAVGRLEEGWSSCVVVVWLGGRGVAGGSWCGWGVVVWLGGRGVAGGSWCGWGVVVWLGGRGVAGGSWCGWGVVVWLGGRGVAGGSWCGWGVVVWLGGRGVVAEVVVRLREVCVGAVSQRCPLAIPGISAGIRSRACRWRSILRRRDEFRARRPSPRGGTRFRGGPSWRAAPSRPRACSGGRCGGVVAVCPGRGFHPRPNYAHESRPPAHRTASDFSASFRLSA